MLYKYIHSEGKKEIYNIKSLIIKVFSRSKDYLKNVTMISIAWTMNMPSAWYELYEQSYLYTMYAGSLIVSIDESDIGESQEWQMSGSSAHSISILITTEYIFLLEMKQG
jgi:hypothetical protein